MIPTPAQSEASPALFPAEANDPLSIMEARRARGAAALLALCAVALLPTLFSPFFADDYFHIEHAARLGEALTHGWVLNVDSGGAWWTPPGLSVEYFRPLVVLSFAIDRFLYGSHAVGYHLTNLVLHATTTLLVWGIARRVIGAGFSAWAAAALFAIHPAHTVAVGWISGRTDVLATVFYATAFFLYLESRSAEGRDRGGASTTLLLLSCFAFGTALLAKEMAITFPAIVLGHALLTRNGEPVVRRLVAPIASGLVGMAYLALRVHMLGGFHAPPPPFAYHLGDSGLAVHLLTAPLLYLADLVMFVPADPMATLPFWRAHPLLLGVFLLFIAYVFAGTLRKAGSRRIAIWALGWMAITLLPVLMLTVGEHFLYLPSIGYCILVGSQLPPSSGSIGAPQRRALAIVGGLVTAVCFGRAAMFTFFSRSAAASIDEAVDALDRAPNAKRVLVADLSASAALAFPHAVRLARPARDIQVEILSLVPRVFPDAGDLSVVDFKSDQLDLRRTSGYLNSYLERALEGPPRRFEAGDSVDRRGYQVTVLESDTATGRPLALRIRLLDPGTTLVLARTSSGLQPLSPH